MSSQLLHCGGRDASFAEVCAVEPPPNTETYTSVPYGDLIRLTTDEVDNAFGELDPNPSMKFGLASKDQRMFGTITYNLDDAYAGGNISALTDMAKDLEIANLDAGEIFKKYAYSIAVRSSYDLSMSVAIAGGPWTFNCDNLAISGSDFTINMKHTKNVWQRIVPEFIMRVRKSLGDWKDGVILLEKLTGTNVSDKEAYELIGLAQGRGVLTPMQSSRVFNEYHSCRKGGHIFSDNHGSAFALYQHFTESLKLGKDMPRKLNRYTGVSKLFKEEFKSSLEVVV